MTERTKGMIFFSILLALVSILTIATGVTAAIRETAYLPTPTGSAGFLYFMLYATALYTIWLVFLFTGTMPSVSGMVLLINQAGFLLIILGILGFVGTVGLLMAKKWGLMLTLVLNIVLLAISLVIVVTGAAQSPYFGYEPALVAVIYSVVFVLYLVRARENFM